MLKRIIKTVLRPVIAVAIAVIIGAVIVSVSGFSSLDVYGTLLNGSLGSVSAIANTLKCMTPLILSGLTFMTGYRAGVFNLGAEGQLYVGAFAAAWVGFSVSGLPSVIHITLCLSAGAAVGAMWAFIPALCKIRFQAPEVITTLMMNYIGILLTDYLVTYPFRGGAVGDTRATVPIFDSAKLSLLIPPYKLTTGIFIAVAVAALIWLMINKTVMGYEQKMVGLNSKFSDYGGISSKKSVLYAMLLGGAIAGIAGSIEILGVQGKFITSFSSNIGMEGTVVSLLGGNHPIGVVFAAFFMGMLKNGALALERTMQIDRDIVTILTSLIILFVTARGEVKDNFIKSFKILRQDKQKPLKETDRNVSDGAERK